MLKLIMKNHYLIKTPVASVLKNNIDLSKLVSSYNDFLQFLTPIAVKRVSGTSDNKKVREVIAKIFIEFISFGSQYMNLNM